MDLQGFIIGRRFIVKEVAVLRKGTVLSHYLFASPMPWHLLTKSDKSQVCWLMANHHGLRWEDGFIPYRMAKRLITRAVTGSILEDAEESYLVYVKGLQKREWLKNILDEDARSDIIIETLDADYEDITSLNNLDTSSTLRCNIHLKHCALQNVLKIFNWWQKHQQELNKL